MVGLSRRRVLSSLAAAVGVGAVAGTRVPAQASTAADTLVLHGSGLRILGPRNNVSPGSPTTVRGVLHSAANGPGVGEFFASGTVLARWSMLDPGLGSFETHLFRIDDSSLTGTGTVHHDGTGQFTITGGTGRFAGAHGSYTSVQSADHSGSGTATFTFTIGYRR